MIKRSLVTALLVCAASLATAHAQSLVVQSNVTFNGSAYHYAYTIDNQTAVDVSSVTISGLPLGDGSVLNLTAPATFVAFFDSGLGLLSFQEGSAAFLAGSSVSGFGFDSTFGPGAASFTAVDINGAELAGATVSAVPEPSTYALIGALVALGFAVYRKRRGSASVPISAPVSV